MCVPHACLSKWGCHLVGSKPFASAIALIYRKIKKQFKKEGEANRTHHVGLVWILAAGIEHRH